MDEPPRGIERYVLLPRDYGRICQERLYWWGNSGSLPLRPTHLKNPEWLRGMHVGRRMSIREDNDDRC